MKRFRWEEDERQRERVLPLAAGRGIRRPLGRRPASHLSGLRRSRCPAKCPGRGKALHPNSGQKPTPTQSCERFCGNAFTRLRRRSFKGGTSPPLRNPQLSEGTREIISERSLIMKKDIKFSTRMASADREKIKALAAKAHMSMSDYVTACCLGKRIIVIDEQKKLLRQLKSIGGNINRLTVLANMGKVQVIGLDKAAQELSEVSAALRAVREGR